MGVIIVLDIKDNKRRAGLFDDEKDFDKQLNLLYDVPVKGSGNIKKEGRQPSKIDYFSAFMIFAIHHIH